MLLEFVSPPAPTGKWPIAFDHAYCLIMVPPPADLALFTRELRVPSGSTTSHQARTGSYIGFHQAPFTARRALVHLPLRIQPDTASVPESPTRPRRVHRCRLRARVRRSSSHSGRKHSHYRSRLPSCRPNITSRSVNRHRSRRQTSIERRYSAGRPGVFTGMSGTFGALQE